MSNFNRMLCSCKDGEVTTIQRFSNGVFGYLFYFGGFYPRAECVIQCNHCYYPCEVFLRQEVTRAAVLISVIDLEFCTKDIRPLVDGFQQYLYNRQIPKTMEELRELIWTKCRAFKAEFDHDIFHVFLYSVAYVYKVWSIMFFRSGGTILNNACELWIKIFESILEEEFYEFGGWRAFSLYLKTASFIKKEQFDDLALSAFLNNFHKSFPRLDTIKSTPFRISHMRDLIHFTIGGLCGPCIYFILDKNYSKVSILWKHMCQTSQARKKLSVERRHKLFSETARKCTCAISAIELLEHVLFYAIQLELSLIKYYETSIKKLLTISLHDLTSNIRRQCQERKIFAFRSNSLSEYKKAENLQYLNQMLLEECEMAIANNHLDVTDAGFCIIHKSINVLENLEMSALVFTGDLEARFNEHFRLSFPQLAEEVKQKIIRETMPDSVHGQSKKAKRRARRRKKNVKQTSQKQPEIPQEEELDDITSDEFEEKDESDNLDLRLLGPRQQVKLVTVNDLGEDFHFQYEDEHLTVRVVAFTKKKIKNYNIILDNADIIEGLKRHDFWSNIGVYSDRNIKQFFVPRGGPTTRNKFPCDLEILADHSGRWIQIQDVFCPVDIDNNRSGAVSGRINKSVIEACCKNVLKTKFQQKLDEISIALPHLNFQYICSNLMVEYLIQKSWIFPLSESVIIHFRSVTTSIITFGANIFS